jgi:hypothetical protein
MLDADDKKWIVRVLYNLAEMIVAACSGNVSYLRSYRKEFEREAK